MCAYSSHRDLWWHTDRITTRNTRQREVIREYTATVNDIAYDHIGAREPR